MAEINTKYTRQIHVENRTNFTEFIELLNYMEQTV